MTDKTAAGGPGWTPATYRKITHKTRAEYAEADNLPLTRKSKPSDPEGRAADLD
ncbi:hypothetical protein GCM10010116_39250 [Microbispora rosea subsp. aerata]|nr:hypothetical protein GCM10010116_39250 [Microbispora rosea subsp. aerata]GLJ81366.1 hypothetical protein GCM10017588_00890 [Microbispora rosea subsp. aerata]